VSFYCAIPPLDMSVARVGRGNGEGWNRMRTRADQYHAGMDFLAAAGSPVLAVVPGRVVLVGLDANRPARNGLNGYGNCVIVQADYSLPPPARPLEGERTPPREGFASPFWMLYAHLQSSPPVSVGQAVQAGTLLGYVGSTTNGRFSGMGAHLHFEVRKRPFPGGSYDRDTIDPAILFASLGIDHVNSRADAERRSGGQLLIRAGGPSDCSGGRVTSLGMFGAGGTLPGSYVDPTVKKIVYSSKGVTLPPTVDADPPDYKEAVQVSAGVSPVVVAAGVGAAILVFASWKKRKNDLESSQ